MYALLALVNFFSLKARGSRRAAHALHYGPHRRQTVDVYTPVGGKGPWPVVYFLYGGSWMLGERGFYEFVGRCLAAFGFVVVVADYRLVPEVEYPAFLEDCAQGFRWTVDHIAEYGGDPGRIAVMGHSAGAYNTMMIMLAPSLLPAIGLAGKVRAIIGLSGPYDFYPFDVDVSIRTFAAVAEPKLTQPVNLVRPGLPPLFLGHGSSDTLVYPRNSVALAAHLRDAGNAVTEKYYSGVGHAGPLLALGAYGRTGSPILADVVAFLRETL